MQVESLHNTPNILLIEDDIDVSNTIARMLQTKGYDTDQCFNGQDGLIAAANPRYDLILLDYMLPKVDGLEILRKLRGHSETPVIMLSACGAEEDRIAGLNDGADDYLPKPFSMTELLLRIRAVLRRRFPPDTQPTVSGHTEDLLLNSAALTVKKEDIEVELTPIEFELISILRNNRGEVLTKPFLYQSVLKKPFNRYDRSLDMHISNLRSKLSPLLTENMAIKTVHGKGYCFA